MYSRIFLVLEKEGGGGNKLAYVASSFLTRVLVLQTKATPKLCQQIVTGIEFVVVK